LGGYQNFSAIFNQAGEKRAQSTKTRLVLAVLGTEVSASLNRDSVTLEQRREFTGQFYGDFWCPDARF
jgi:hypothetical protein